MENTTPFFSVIVPVYNTSAYIESSIGSILDQTWQDLEIIAVDDGSTDESRQLLDAIAGRDPRLRVFAKENGGQGAARNYALAQARGRYVAFVDSDDTISLDLFSTISDIVSDIAVDVVSFGIAFVDPDGRTVARRGTNAAAAAAGSSIFIDAMLDRNFYSVVWNKVYRRSLLQDHDIRFPELRAYEDSVFSRHVALHARKVVYLDRPMYFALTRSGSTSRGMNEASFTRAAEMLALERRQFRDQFADPCFDTIFRAHTAHFLAYLLVLAAFRIDDPDVRRACWRIANESGFYDCARDQRAIALLDRKAKVQVFLARNPAILRTAALIARRMGRVPY
jgi:glycosyltransferase involved in cell wall biosynthesis